MTQYKVLSPFMDGLGLHQPGDIVSLDEAIAQDLLAKTYPVIEVTTGQLAPVLTPEPDLAPEPSVEASAPVSVEPSPALVNINTATLEELVETFKQVNGVGKGSAQAIIDNRPYESLEAVPDQADLFGAARGAWPQVMPLLTV